MTFYKKVISKKEYEKSLQIEYYQKVKLNLGVISDFSDFISEKK